MSERGTALQRCGLGSRADGGSVTAVVTDGSIRTEHRTSGGLTAAMRGLMFALLVGLTPTPRPADLGRSGRLYACHILCHRMQTTSRTQTYSTDTQA
jgi:hypothetical protein